MEGQALRRMLKKISNMVGRKTNIKILTAVLLYLILNTLKIALFNYYIIPVQTLETLKYKIEITLFLSIAFYPVIFKIKSRTAFIMFYILQTVYILANMSYFLYFHSYLHILQWLSLFTEAFKAAGHSAEPLSAKMLIVFIDLPAFLYIVFKYFEVVKANFKIRKIRRPLAVISLIMVFIIGNGTFAYGDSMIQSTNDRFKGESPVVQRYGTFVNDIMSICSNSNEKKMISQLKYGKEQSNEAESEDKPNFIIIQVESMDANIINKQYGGEYVTPFLHSLSTKNVYYPYVMSYHKGGGTSDSEFSTINSVESLDSFPAIKLSSYQYPNSLISKLSNSGYTTMAFHGNMGSFYNRDAAFPKMGFQKFFDMEKMNLHDIGWGAPDKDVFNFAKKQIAGTKTPFLSYIITMTSHGPFTNARNYYNNPIYDSIKDETTRNYFNSMSYVDQSIKEFVSSIEASCKNTYVFIWGDHTPSVNTADYKQASMTIGDRYFEFVPFIAVTPDHKSYRENGRVASFLDISPTVLYTSGTRFNLESDGINLLRPGGAGSEIPFKGTNFDRSLLYKKISEVK